MSSVALIEEARESTSQRLSVSATAALLVADVVGTGILALPSNVHTVGMAFGIAFIAAQVPLNQFAGKLLCGAASSVETDGRAVSDFRDLSALLAGPLRISRLSASQ